MITVLCAGLTLALALLVAIHLRLAALPAAVWSAMRRERQENTTQALDAMKEAVAARAGKAVIAIERYEDNVAASFRAQVAEAETRARVAERRAEEAAAVLDEARGLVSELRVLLATARASDVRVGAAVDPRDRPTLPPSEPPGALPPLRDDEEAVDEPRGSTTRAIRPCVVPPPREDCRAAADGEPR